MVRWIINWSTRNRFLVGLAVLFIGGAGVWALRTIPLEALPDLTDVQVIVQTDHAEQAPQIVEDQVTYPITTEMLKVPGARTVRGFSFFGMSLVYVIFDDGADLYWARSRVLEYLNGLRGRLPASADPVVGPDATGLGWVYQYVVTSDRHSLYELRAIQDWYLRYVLTAVPGVSEVASVGGFEKQYQVEVDPVRLQAFNVPITRVMAAVEGGNVETGARVLEVSGREYMIRALGYSRGIRDLEEAVVGTTASGTPIRVRDVAEVGLGPDIRRGAADWNGRGEAVGGIVVMRFGENALTTIERVKERLAEVEPNLPEGVRIVPVYDRSDLIERAVETLKEKLTEESLVVAAVCVVFLLHLRSAFVAIVTLPLGVLMSMIVMRWMGLSADIMSLGGIAIAIGAMVDAAVVMIENMHKHLERERGARGEERAVTSERRWEIVREAAGEVGPPLFFSLLIITVSFMPVFTLEAQEGRLFRPLAFTKTFAMAASALLAITVVPVAMGYFIRGRIRPERANPVNRALQWLYRPLLLRVLDHPWKTVAVCALLLLASLVPAARLGSEFMPPLDEGTLLYMPTTIPGASITAGRQALQYQDSILRTFPEVASVFGKVGRANTATDPAQLDMIETTVVLKPHHEWRPGMTRERLVAMMDSAVRTTGYVNAWTQPIRGRIDMLATGIRTPVGIKIFGPDLRELERIGREIEQMVMMVPGTRSVFAERAVSGSYLDIEVDRERAARYGLNVADVQRTITSAIGGMQVTTTVEGRQRFSVNVRYRRGLRDSPDALRRVLIPVQLGSAGASGMTEPVASATVMSPGPGLSRGTTVQIPLGQLATIRLVNAPMLVKTEDAFLTSWVQVDMEGRDLGGYVREAQAMVDSTVTLPPGVTLRWSGQYEYMERAVAKLKVVVPLALLIIVVLLYLNFHNVRDLSIVLLSLPFALVGGVWFLWALGYNVSVAVAVGFIALFGVAAETGIVMLIYLDLAVEHRKRQGLALTPALLHEAIVEGAAERLRPKMMTVAAIMAGLFPLMWGSGAGGSVMRRIAAPMIGGMVSSTVLTLLVIPAIYLLWRRRDLGRVAEGT